MGGWVRMGNRPNEGYAEMTVCLYLPDGRVGFMFKRPQIDGHDAHDAGGLRFEVRRAVRGAPRHLRRQGVRARRAARDGRPASAFDEQPARAVHRSTSRSNAVGTPWGGEPEWEEGEAKPDLDPEKMFARGHTEQHMRSPARSRSATRRSTITDGLGLRDHSWGPRFWQNIWWYRWLTVNLGPDLGFACTISGTEEPDERSVARLPVRRRPLRRRRSWVPIRDVELTSDYDDEWFPTKNHADGHDRRPRLRGRRRRVVEHPAAQPPRRAWSRASPKA